MKLNELAPASGSKRVRRRIGRGHGSGRGKTAGAGTKGQNARSGGGVKPYFEGGQNPWTMRVPHKRGFSRARFRVVTQVINLEQLERSFPADGDVTLEALARRGLIRDGSGGQPIKLLGRGQLSRRLTVHVHAASASARAAVEQAGGSLVFVGAAASSRDAAASSSGVDGGAAPELAQGSPVTVETATAVTSLSPVSPVRSEAGEAPAPGV